MDNNNMNIKQTIQLLGIQEVTTKRQKNNGTREFELPIKDSYTKKKIRVASFASGYVRNQNSASSNYQLNKRIESEPQYYDIDGKYIEYTTRTCKLIPNEQDRLKYLISYCLKNYYINQANKLSSGEFIPKWKYDDHVAKAYDGGCMETPEVKVIVNGQKYNVI